MKFNKHHVAANGVKARVRYSLDNRADGRACVTLYAKDYGYDLHKVFEGCAPVKNDTDSQTDYFETSRVNLFADHPHYAAARVVAEAWDAKFRAAWAPKVAA